MKKILKVLLITITLFISFTIANEVVKAEEPLIGYGVCTYEFTKGQDQMLEKYINGSTISFYFTEVSFKSDNVTGVLFMKNSDYDDYFTRPDSLGTAKGYGLLKNNSNASLGNAASTFKTAFEANGGACPKVFLMKKNDKKAYIPYFDNTSSTEYCGTGNENCIVVAKYSNDSGTVKVYPSEKTWNYTHSGKGSCDNAQTTLYFDTAGKLKADISYPKSSTFYEKSAKKTVTVSVAFGHDSCGSAEASCQFRYLRDFVTTGTIKNGMIRGDEGNEKLRFNDHGVSSNSCDWKPSNNNSITTTENYSCKNFSSVSTTIDSKMTLVTNAGKKIDSAAETYLKQNSITAKYESKVDYSKETDAASIRTAATTINTALSDTAFETQAKSYQDYLSGLISGGTLCTEAVASVQEKQEDLTKTYDDYLLKIAGLKTTLQSMQTRLTALGDTDGAEAIDDYIDKAEDLEDNINTYKKSAITTNYLSGIDFKIEEISGATCGIISKDLRDFLQTIIDYIRIAGIVLAVILGILDYIKAIFGTDEQSMKKANKNLTTRLIAVALLFLIPALLNFILSLFNVLDSSNAGTCGIV